MTDNEKSSALTDAEIIKALNEALHGLHYIGIYCADRKGNYIASVRVIDVINLINRLQSDKEALIAGQETLQKALAERNAEVERLTGMRNADPMDFCGVLCRYSEELINKARAEAIKELLNKIEKQAIPNEDDVYWVELDDIYNSVKEMVGETE